MLDWQSERLGGLEALALGLHDGGIRFTTLYPGFHAQELGAWLGCPAISVNEKNALALAWGASVAGTRSAALFKNVGLNDAADPYVNASRLGVNAGLVLVVLDDWDVEQSQIQQDSRPYAELGPVLWLEPVSPAQAYELAFQAPALSEQLDTLVVLRVTNLLCQATGAVQRRPQAACPSRPFPRDPERWVAHPVTVAAQQARLARRQQALQHWVESVYPAPSLRPGQERFRIQVGCPDSPREELPADLTLFTLPLPQNWLTALARSDTSLEVQEHGLPWVTGKLATALAGSRVAFLPVRGSQAEQCYRVVERYEPLYAVLRAVEARILVGDLGGHTMDPARSIDVCLCYGCSLGVATGIALTATDRQVICVTGDAAFLHSGQTALVEAQARRAPITVVLLDNGGCQGTGGQRPPGHCAPWSPGLPWYEAAFTEAPAFLERLLSARPVHPGPRVVRVPTPF
jgi:indolepyruvate ferredoxin oxidoreductase alpha subunit